MWDDPFKPGRRGIDGLGQRIEVNSPLELVILVLGTNDFQSMHPHSAWHSAQGVAALVQAIRSAPSSSGMPVPPVLVVAPPPFDDPRGPVGPKFVGARPSPWAWRQRCGSGFTLGCAYFDAGTVTPPAQWMASISTRNNTAAWAKPWSRWWPI